MDPAILFRLEIRVVKKKNPVSELFQSRIRIRFFLSRGSYIRQSQPQSATVILYFFSSFEPVSSGKIYFHQLRFPRTWTLNIFTLFKPFVTFLDLMINFSLVISCSRSLSLSFRNQPLYVTFCIVLSFCLPLSMLLSSFFFLSLLHSPYFYVSLIHFHCFSLALVLFLLTLDSMGGGLIQPIYFFLFFY